MFGLSFQEVIVVGIVAVLLFGKRLPEVARSLGSSYRDFRKGLAEFQGQVDFSDTYSAPRSAKPARTYNDYDEYDSSTAPKFEPPPSSDLPSSDPPRNVEPNNPSEAG